MSIELAKCWLWAAMHHKDFKDCQLSLDHPPIRIRSYYLSIYNPSVMSICLDIYIPQIYFYLPYNIVQDYQKAMLKTGKTVIITDVTDDIPF